jgi:hypothetical protein
MLETQDDEAFSVPREIADGVARESMTLVVQNEGVERREKQSGRFANLTYRGE